MLALSCLPWLFEQAEIKSKPMIKIKKMLRCLFTAMKGNYKDAILFSNMIVQWLKCRGNMTTRSRVVILCHVAFNTQDFAQVFRLKPEFLRVEWVANNFEH